MFFFFSTFPVKLMDFVKKKKKNPFLRGRNSKSERSLLYLDFRVKMKRKFATAAIFRIICLDSKCSLFENTIRRFIYRLFAFLYRFIYGTLVLYQNPSPSYFALFLFNTKIYTIILIWRGFHYNKNSWERKLNKSRIHFNAYCMRKHND